MIAERTPKRSARGASTTASPVVVQFGMGATHPRQPRPRCAVTRPACGAFTGGRRSGTSGSIRKVLAALTTGSSVASRGSSSRATSDSTAEKTRSTPSTRPGSWSRIAATSAGMGSGRNQARPPPRRSAFRRCAGRQRWRRSRTRDDRGARRRIADRRCRWLPRAGAELGHVVPSCHSLTGTAAVPYKPAVARRHRQVVRQGSAKPSFPGSNPGGASSLP